MSIVDRAIVDTSRFWTMVHIEPFQHDCTIEEVDVFAGGDGSRPLRIGLFRRNGTTMEFTLISFYDALNVPIGKSTVKI